MQAELYLHVLFKRFLFFGCHFVLLGSAMNPKSWTKKITKLLENEFGIVPGSFRLA